MIPWSGTPKRSSAYPVKTNLTPTRVVLTYQVSNVPHAMAKVCLIDYDYVVRRPQRACRNHIDRAGGGWNVEMVTVHGRYAGGDGGD